MKDFDVVLDATAALEVSILVLCLSATSSTLLQLFIKKLTIVVVNKKL